MKQADYQLRHRLFGQAGSFWSRQANDDTRDKARALVAAAGNAGELQKTDLIAASVVGPRTVMVEDASFTFSDGDFAIVGRHQTDYEHVTITDADGVQVRVALHPENVASSSTPKVSALARVSQDFLQKIAAGTYSTDRDWYLVPIPKDLYPLTIQTRVPGELLVAGIDYEPRLGYIVLAANPAEVLPTGVVRVPSALLELGAPNSYTLNSPLERRGSRYLADYAKVSQSLVAFRRAAAEFAGLHVFTEPDVVLRVQSAGGATVYTMAAAGPLVIDYDHDTLRVVEEVLPGRVVGGRFEIIPPSSVYGWLMTDAASDWGVELSLDGILPVKGLTWKSGSPVDVTFEGNSAGGYPHMFPNFNGDAGVVAKYLELYKAWEAETSTYLYDELSLTSTADTQIDFGNLIETLYGSQLAIFLSSRHRPDIDARLKEFLLENHPSACVMMTGLDTSIPANALVDDRGIPFIDEYGHYSTP